MKTCLVAGGAGFIGSWLCEDLLKKNYEVVCVDNFITGRRENLVKGAEFLETDISKDFSVDRKVDYIFHLASPASPVHYQKHPVETLLANSTGTLNLLKLAKKNNARMFYASSSEVYGEPLVHPQKETYWGNVNSYGPRSCYDEGKRFSEAMIRSFSSVDARIGRIFNTYGPRMNREDGRVIPNFITQALSGKPITIYGKGEQTRSFCFVSDTVDCIEKMIFSSAAKGEVVNIGNPNEISMIEAANTIKKLTGSKSKFVFRDLPKDDPTKRKPDISKARKLLGWTPKVGFEEGLRTTIDYFR